MTYKELKKVFINHEANRSSTDDPLIGYIVFTEDSFNKQFSEKSRTYKVYSDCKAFMPDKCGYSIFGSCIDGTDIDVRLDKYMVDEQGGKNGWKVERCYLEEGIKCDITRS